MEMIYTSHTITKVYMDVQVLSHGDGACQRHNTLERQHLKGIKGLGLVRQNLGLEHVACFAVGHKPTHVDLDNRTIRL
jgi:hypothetical protein